VQVAAEELVQKGFALLHDARVQPWGQTVARLQSPEGLIIDLSYAPALQPQPARPRARTRRHAGCPLSGSGRWTTNFSGAWTVSGHHARSAEVAICDGCQVAIGELKDRKQQGHLAEVDLGG
jgi:hypothetical protein